MPTGGGGGGHTLELWGKWRPRSADGVRMNNESGPCSDHGTGWTALVVVVVLVRLAMLVRLARLALVVCLKFCSTNNRPDGVHGGVTKGLGPCMRSPATLVPVEHSCDGPTAKTTILGFARFGARLTGKRIETTA